MVMKEGIGSDGIGAAGSVSLMSRRDRGRYSPEERMKGSLENKPPAPDELRFRPGAGGRLDAGKGVSGPVPGCDVDWSMAGDRVNYGVGLMSKAGLGCSRVLCSKQRVVGGV